MIKLKDIKFKDFLDLYEFLKSLDRYSEDENEKNIYAVLLLENFISDINADELLELSYILENKNEEMYNNFNNEYDFDFDPNGRITSNKDKKYWKINLKLSDDIFDKMNSIENKTRKIKYCISGRTLECFKNYNLPKNVSYMVAKKLLKDSLIKKNIYRNYDIILFLDNIETSIKDIFTDENIIRNILNKIVYFSKDNINDDLYYLIETLNRNIKILLDDKDKESDFSKNFYENISNL